MINELDVKQCKYCGKPEADCLPGEECEVMGDHSFETLMTLLEEQAERRLGDAWEGGFAENH